MTAATLSDEAILASLKAHPGLRDRFASIIGAIENSEGNFKEADAVEERIVEEMLMRERERLTFPDADLAAEQLVAAWLGVDQLRQSLRLSGPPSKDAISRTLTRVSRTRPGAHGVRGRWKSWPPRSCSRPSSSAT